MGAVYTLTVSNVGIGPTTAAVTVADVLPASLGATAIAGTGWSCALGTLSCTRADVLTAGASYPAISVTVNVSATASGTVTNTASVSGGGDANGGNNSAVDAATVGAGLSAIVPVPLLSAPALALLALVLAVFAARSRRLRPHSTARRH